MLNRAPNSRWLVHSALPLVTKYNWQSTGTLPQLSVSSHTIGGNTVVCQCADTSQLEVGDLGVFDTGHANLRLSPLRVLAVVPNVSFTVRLPFNLTVPSSSACLFRPAMIGDLTGVTGEAADKWKKTPEALYWVEDRAVNLMPQSSRAAALKKSTASAQLFYHEVDTRDVRGFRGREVVFGGLAFHKIKGGAGTWEAVISDDGGQTFATGTPTPGSGYQHAWVSKRIAETATSILYGYRLLGASGDVYFFAEPMFDFGTSLTVESYSQRPDEMLTPVVHVSPWIDESFTFPAGASEGTDFLVDLYAEGSGAIAPGVRVIDTQIEGRCNEADRAFVFQTSPLAPSRTGAEVISSQVAGLKESGAGSMEINADGTVWCHGTPGSSWHNVTIDMNRFQVA